MCILPSRRVRVLSLYKQRNPGTSRYHRIASVSCNIALEKSSAYGFILIAEPWDATLPFVWLSCRAIFSLNFLLSTESSMLRLHDLFQHVMRFSSAGMISASRFSQPGFTSAAWPSCFMRIEGVCLSFGSHLTQGLGGLGSANSRQDCAVGNWRFFVGFVCVTVHYSCAVQCTHSTGVLK